MTDRLIIARDRLGTLEPMGRGGTALVYGLPDLAPSSVGVVTSPGLVYKEYKARVRRRAGAALGTGLRALVAFREDRLTDAERQRWDDRVIWPVRLVVESSGAAVGIVMPLIPTRFFQRVRQRSGQPRLVTREADKLFGDAGDMRRIGIPPVSTDVRLRVVRRLAATYERMHRGGIVIGDISGRNVVYDPGGERPAVLVLDADSARMESTVSAFGSQPHTPHWEPPEALAAALRYRTVPGSAHPDTVSPQSRRTDVYKFALMAVRILDYGRERSVNRDPAIAMRVLRRAHGPGAADLLRASLADDPADRPGMREWFEAFHPGRRAGDDEPDRARSAGPVAPGDAAASPPAGHVLGGWEFVAGSGWHRRAPRG